MNYVYALLYVVMCVIMFVVIFFSNEAFEFLFEKTINDITITDYNDPEYTGGVTYNFNPGHQFNSKEKTGLQ